jgi:predicted adenine nucleotide alpha hydrolase (AANH) superfamily ATPase
VSANDWAKVTDALGHEISPCRREKAQKLLAAGKASLVSEEPLVIALSYAVDVPTVGIRASEREAAPVVGGRRRLLLHICCGPCSTYPIGWLRDNGYELTGLWYNPNIHPFQEHEARRDSAMRYAQIVGLDGMWDEPYEMPHFMRVVAGHERFRERCRKCYQLRLERTAQLAAHNGFDGFTTTLLVSIHQDQRAIREIGEVLARQYAVPFLFENFRRGWAERGRLARQYDLYMQQYCGCLYSEWERYSRRAVSSSDQADST